MAKDTNANVVESRDSSKGHRGNTPHEEAGGALSGSAPEGNRGIPADANPLKPMTSQDRKLLGSLIRSARKRRGITAAQLGGALDPSVTESAVTSWERGRTAPSYLAVEQIDGVLGVSLNDLMSAREKSLGSGALAYPEREEKEVLLLGYEQMLSMEGLERLVEYAEFLAERHPREDSAK